MQITLETKPYAALEAEALVTYVFEEADPIQGRIAELDQATGGLLKKIAASGELTGKTLGSANSSAVRRCEKLPALRCAH
jgi:hypothetical protein